MRINRSSLADLLDRNRGIGPGFDFCRLFLSTTVMLTHSIQQSDSPIAYSSWFDLRFYLLPAFFSLSGFLIWGSFLRIQSLGKFMTFRALRIFPALMTEVVLSALLLGPIVTSLPLNEYFSDAAFHSYFFNLIGYIHYELPGVFLENHSRQVNGSLFTVPSEMACYVSLAFLISSGIAKRPTLLLLSYIAYISALLIGLIAIKGSISTVTTDWKLFPMYFYSGALLFILRSRIPYHGAFVLAATSVFAVGIFLSPLVLIVLGPPCISYIVCYAGLTNLPRIPLLMSGDYSYGIYLYGFPIQQMMFFAFPSQSWVANFACSFPLTCLFAMFSWWCIERPCLQLRKYIFAPTSSKKQEDPANRFVAH